MIHIFLVTTIIHYIMYVPLDIIIDIIEYLISNINIINLDENINCAIKS